MFLGMDGSYNFRWSAAVNVFRKTDAYKDYPYDNSRGVEFDFENLREIAKNC